MKRLLIIILVQMMIFQLGLSQSKGEIQKWKKEYSKISKPEIPINDYVEMKQRASKNVKLLKSGKTRNFRYRTAEYLNDNILCSIGGFENTNSFNQNFNGGYADHPPNLDYNSFTGGLSTSSDISLGESRQTIVSIGDDPTITQTLNTTHTGNKALRIGNRKNGHGVEFISVDINVSNPLISFWYAMVLHDPSGNHSDSEIPFFEVRVLNSNGNEINNVVNLGGNNNRIASNDPFLLQANVETGVSLGFVNQLRYKPWSCAQINLSNHIGDNVTIQFINSDCSQGAHMSYTYIDDISCEGCGSSPTGGLSFNNANSDCSLNKICFDYSLPDNSINTGDVNIMLEVRGDNYNKVYNSGNLNSGDSYCFTIPASDVNHFGDGYDFVAVASFSLNGQNVNTLNSGTWPEGQIVGSHNDCELSKPHNFSLCCPPMNKDLLITLFTHIPNGGLQDPYRLQFVNNPTFNQLSQAYLDYIKTIDNNINQLKYNWRIYEAGTGTSPGTLNSLTPYSNYFTVGGGGTIQGGTNFFNNNFVVGKWYKIHVDMETVPKSDVFGKECSKETYFFYRNQIQNGKMVGMVSDGRRVVKRIPISASSFKKSKTRGRRN